MSQNSIKEQIEKELSVLVGTNGSDPVHFWQDIFKQHKKA